MPSKNHPQIVNTSEGECELPIRYRDGTVAALLFRVDPATVRALLGTHPLAPVSLGGHAIALLAAFEYRDSSVGAYNEVGLAVQVRRAGTSNPGGVLGSLLPSINRDAALHVLHLPVTTALANAAGREIWGYPKYVSPIRIARRRDGLRVDLHDELEFTLERPGALRTPAPPFITVSNANDCWVRTHISSRHVVRWGGAAEARIRVYGDGPLAETARRLKLDAMRPAAVFRGDRLRATLPMGEPW